MASCYTVLLLHLTAAFKMLHGHNIPALWLKFFFFSFFLVEQKIRIFLSVYFLSLMPLFVLSHFTVAIRFAV